MKAISVAQAQAFDRHAQKKYKIPSLLLMENAGRGVAEVVLGMVRGMRCGGRGGIAIICGTGNNGGDGFVAARHLLNAGVKVKVFIIGDIKKLKADPKINYNILLKMKIGIVHRWKPATKPLDVSRGKRRGFRGCDLIIDAIFGIGLNSEVKEPYSDVIEEINKAKIPVLSVDVPSGLDADTGNILGTAIKAQRTVTFVAPKKGFYAKQGPRCCGKIIVRDIGIA